MPLSSANAYARLVRTRPTHRSLAQALYCAVDRARHHVYVENPYFSDSLLQVKLAKHESAKPRKIHVKAAQ